MPFNICNKKRYKLFKFKKKSSFYCLRNTSYLCFYMIYSEHRSIFSIFSCSNQIQKMAFCNDMYHINVKWSIRVKICDTSCSQFTRKEVSVEFMLTTAQKTYNHFPLAADEFEFSLVDQNVNVYCQWCLLMQKPLTYH